MSEEEVRRAVDHAYRNEWARVIAATTRTTRDLDLAEECAQDAFAEALTSWPRDGVPTNPGAWLTTIAKRRAIDSIRRASTYRTKLPLLIQPEPTRDGDTLPMHAADIIDEKVVSDDTLRLVFMCCHPSLSNEAQTALTLRLVCGMTTPDIARCFLASESTMAARLSRAKRKISIARIPFIVPSTADLPERLGAVLSVIYLLFTIGHTAPSGEQLVRIDTVSEAIRLARLLHKLVPNDSEVKGLLALLLVNDARRESRLDDDGRAQRISEQDRSTWNHDMIREARHLINTNPQSEPRGQYTLQAAIALLHAEAPSFDEVDWTQIVRTYDELVFVWPSPVVQLNRAVAVSKTAGPEAALKIIKSLEDEGQLNRYQYLPAVKAYLLDLVGRHDEANGARTRAIDLANNDVERDFLSKDII
jgi:RNA polymerase sigma-70 factor (ECF subfamily)